MGCNRHLEDSPEECSEARELGSAFSLDVCDAPPGQATRKVRRHLPSEAVVLVTVRHVDLSNFNSFDTSAR